MKAPEEKEEKRMKRIARSEKKHRALADWLELVTEVMERIFDSSSREKQLHKYPQSRVTAAFFMLFFCQILQIKCCTALYCVLYCNYETKL